MQNRKRFLSSILINKGFQFRFVAFALLNTLVLSAVYFIAAELFFTEFEVLAKRMDPQFKAVVLDFLGQQRETFYLLMGGSFFLLSLFTIYNGLWLSHRVAGPIYRLTISLQQMAETKKLSYIYFRKKDYFQEIPTEFNGVVKVLDEAETTSQSETRKSS